ncbi:hypothetical protein MYK68_13965 [Gordonia sp. PP30]|uniref:hypothetical protein n=1 Tax=Gordonia sp. PP30 TaxID=2935861 RepID=UPI001FFFC42F|nr:hypothetical protein [Gordonia sp. PP30]UQE73836.1 hypothetical protein MYK68_13965 [Gordonia sp. PP30]
MSVNDGFAVTVYGVDGSRWDVHGPLAGRQGVWLGEGQVQAIYDAPIETRWATTAGGRGARPRRRVWLPRDFTLGFHVNDDTAGRRESALALALGSEPYPWDPARRAARMVITAPLQDDGPRTLYFEAKETPELVADQDTLAAEYANTLYSCRAGQPLYESEPEAVAFEQSGTSGAGTVVLSNPSDTACEYTVELTPATWTLPDPSWTGQAGAVAPGGPHAARTLTAVVEPGDVTARFTRRRDQLLAQTAAGTNLVARQQGRFLVYDLPAWLPPTPLPISYTGAPPGGARAEYTLPRLWTRPWGMSLADRPAEVLP